MSVSALSPSGALGSVSGLPQVVSLLGLVLLLLKAAQLYLRRQWLLKALHHFPSPPSHWFYGHKKEESELPLLLERVEKYPRAHVHWLSGTRALVLVYDPDYMKMFLGRSDPKPQRTYKYLTPWIGTGLLLLEGQTWFQHRQMLIPAFHYDILKTYVGIMANSVRVMLDKWEELVSQDSHLEIFGHVSLTTLDTIMKCAFSHQGSVQTDRDHLDQMPYMTMCIKEALRLYPPVPVIGRELSKPITFPDGCSLPTGSTRHSYAFLPFSGGSRNCVRKQFAMNELKVAMALTLLHFELSPDPCRIPVPTPIMVLRSKNGIHLQLRKLSDAGGDKDKL